MRGLNLRMRTRSSSVGGDSSRRLASGSSESATGVASHKVASHKVASYNGRGRGGAILVVVIVCLAAAAGVIVLVAKQAAAERHVMLRNYRSLQALWLAEAGVERAAARLVADAKYAGETWDIPAKELANDGGAVVRIQVSPIADQPERRLLRVEADYPDTPECRCRQTKQTIVDRDELKSRQQTKTSK
jgi:hypothetical protein